MKNLSTAVKPFVWTALLAFCVSSALASADPEIDRQVWRMQYGLEAGQVSDPLWLAQDTDADGLTNAAELEAGTNPLLASSRLAVTELSHSPHAVSLTFPTLAGKLYLVESSAAPLSTSWMAFDPPVQVTGNGAPQTVAAPIGSDAFYRTRVQNLDTDGDQVSDWAEIITGYDPNSAHSNGAAQDDHASLSAQLAAANVVTLVASDPSTTQPPDTATAPASNGSITVSRGGALTFSTITVPLVASGTALAGTDYVPAAVPVTFQPGVSVVKIPIVPLANPARRSNVTVTLQAQPGGGYTLGAPSSASVVIQPAGNATGTGLTGYYYNSTFAAISAGYNPAVLFAPANLRLTRNDATVDFTWNSISPGPGVNPTYYVVRWVGQVQPQYSETYYFVTRTNDGVKLWVNGQLIVDKWINQGATDWTGEINLRAGVLYDIRMEYYQATGNGEAHLSWYSENQVKQIIPTVRLYPDTVPAAPPSITSALSATGFVDQPFAFNVTASNSINVPTLFSLGASGGSLPPGLSLNAATGLISGVPTVAGDYQVALVATNAFGTGSSVLKISILDTGNALTREIWTSGVTGSGISGIPVNAPPSSIDNSLNVLDDPTDYADGTAKRLRGYFTAPATGNYYFWLAASNAAELWISNNAEPVNNVRRAVVNAPGTGSQIWNAQPTQKSPWLALVEGRRYYFEVLHHHGSGTPDDHLAVAWFIDPTGTTADPVANQSGVVPGHLLSPFDYPVTASQPGTLYATNMQPQGLSVTSAVGSANLRLNADNTQAILHFQFSGLGSPRTAYHVHTDAFGTHPSQIIYDIDDIDQFHPELRTADGGYIWNIEDVGTLTAAEVVSLIQEGKAYINIHSVEYPQGEIRGNFSLVIGSQTPPTPVPDPGYNPADASTDAGAARFLNQASFGASPADVAYVKANGYQAWLDQQFALPPSYFVPEVLANVTANPQNPYPSTLVFNAWWKRSVTASDQLRQRVAFALSEILVVSAVGPLDNNARALADFYDTLLDGAFGNFRDLLENVTLTPGMGLYLDMRANQKGSLITGVNPNENYAREIMQLFSLGLNRLWPDGSLVLDSAGNLIPTYDQKVIDGVSRVLTGWNYNQPLQGNGRLPVNFNPAANFLEPMVLVPTRHELGSKLVLDNVVLPPAQGYSIYNAPVPGSEADPAQPAFDTYCLQDLEKALDSMFYNASVGPYICRQLIQRLVTSHPSPAYLHRVVDKFNDDGSPQHVRGNLEAVVRAILLDGEARNLALTSNTFGKQREPLLRITGPARAFPVVTSGGPYAQTGGAAITVTTSAPHLLAGGNGVFLDFTGNTPIPTHNPSSVNYTVLNNPPPTATTFAVNATGLQGATYTQAAGSNVITVNANNAPLAGARLYLHFLTGGAPGGLYTVVSQPTANSFAISTPGPPPTSARNGNALIPRVNAGYMVRNQGSPPTSTITVGTVANHNLQVNDHVWIDFNGNIGSQNIDAGFTVSSIIDEDHFTIVVPNSTLVQETEPNSVIYLLIPPPLNRTGNVALERSRFDAGFSNNDLAQTPLDSPTVFNFFFPDYKYPGTLGANNITTPEFQLTTDTNVVTLTNTVSGAVLSSNNANGLTSYRNGNGAITMDLSPYMTAGQTSDAAIPALVDRMSDLLAGGQVSPETKAVIVGFVANTTNFPLSGTPTNTQMRDRVRAVAHLILTSAEYAIQK